MSYTALQSLIEAAKAAADLLCSDRPELDSAAAETAQNIGRKLREALKQLGGLK